MKAKMFALVCLLLATCSSFVMIHQVTNNFEIVAQSNEYKAQLDAIHFDTSALNNWGGDFSDGDIRIMGGYFYDENTIEDDTGNLWLVDTDISEDNFYLLWIADNHTSDDVTDDVILKIWVEAH